MFVSKYLMEEPEKQGHWRPRKMFLNVFEGRACSLNMFKNRNGVGVLQFCIFFDSREGNNGKQKSVEDSILVFAPIDADSYVIDMFHGNEKHGNSHKLYAVTYGSRLQLAMK